MQGVIVLKGLFNRVTRKPPVNLFFLELIIVLLFFSISGAIILKVFASASIATEKGSVTERAVMNVQSVAEIYSVKGDLEESLDMLFGKGRYTIDSDGTYSVCLGNDMQPIITEDIRGRYGRVSIEFSERRTKGLCGEMHELDSKVILLADGGSEVYTQTSAVYVPKRIDTGKEAEDAR